MNFWGIGSSPASPQPGVVHPGRVRVAILAETFLPHMNGVTGSVLHIVRHLQNMGHETLVIAPRGKKNSAANTLPDGMVAELLPSIPLPRYPQVRLVAARAATIAKILQEFRADVVHLASPFLLGWQGLLAAERLGIPTVAVYQTDVIAYAERYGVPRASGIVEAHITRLHRRATLTLVPSRASLQQLDGLGVDSLRIWGRGVDTEMFHPSRRRECVRQRIGGEILVACIGRLAVEKQLSDLRVLDGIPQVTLVVVGQGPARAELEALLPRAVFTGQLAGRELAELVASCDIVVHPGESETFGQVIQEALASGVPVVATGVGGPRDLVRSSINGWLYRPGDLSELRSRVQDLAGDAAKRRAFARAARESVEGKTWEALTEQLVGYYEEARGGSRAPRRWQKYIALGDSLTEGLCDSSRMAEGGFRGWADRLAEMLGHSSGTEHYANLALRSRKVRHLVRDQIPEALRLRPDLVSILIGANDLVHLPTRVQTIARDLDRAVATLRAAGSDVLLATTFLPKWPEVAPLRRRFAAYNRLVRAIAARHGAILLDLERDEALREAENWASDRVHLGSRGHRHVAFLAGARLGVPDAESLLNLDAAFHEDERPTRSFWWRHDVMPWVWRRLRGVTAGDGRTAKHGDYVPVGRAAPAQRDPRAVL